MKEFLHDKEARVLGIYGMRGIGKTTLVKKFNDELVRSRARRRFAHIIFIQVSESPNIDRIKTDIERQIGGNLSSPRRSRFLLLLDDVCQDVDLIRMGIPIVPSIENKCKVILTSRLRSHSRVDGVCPTSFTQFLEVILLPELEAWNFFKRNLGRDLDQIGGEIVVHARNIVQKCGGLPLALQIIGNKMADASSVDVWREAERDLSKSSHTIEGVAEDVLHFMDHEAPGPGQPVITLPEESLAGQEQLNNYLTQMEEFLNDEKARVLGIYGMGGIGKTTLMRKFNNQLVGSNSRRRFDHIIFIEVSQSPETEKIKRDIEKQIGDELSSLSKSRFLLLLDDVWKEIDLMNLGIPIPSSKNRCKVIMTGRSQSYCYIKHVNRSDAATRSFPVSALTELEAWIFFQRHIGRRLNSESGEISRLAKSMARKCGGLPLALEVLGKSMGQASSVNEWREAERKLIRSPQMIEDFEKDVLNLLKYSFDRLKDDNNIKNCLLYCCLFKDDAEIAKDSLIDYWFGEGFLDNDYSKSLHEAQDRGHENIAKLISFSLLQEGYENKYVKMYDVVRDMSLWLTSGDFVEYGKFYSYYGRDYNYTSSNTALLNIRRLCVTTDEYFLEKTPLNNFIPGPNLETFRCHGGFSFAEGFFQCCTSLRVLELRFCVLNFALEDLLLLQKLRHLDLSSTKLRNLPTEIGSLANLVYLNFSWNKGLSILPDSIGALTMLNKLNLSGTQISNLPHSIGSLTQLELLDLRRSKLKHLPNSIGKLVNLRKLDLSNCEVENLPDSIGSLSQLELLDLRRSKLKHLPNSIGKLVNLRILHLPNFELENLPHSIGSLTMLKELNISGTKISTLPESIGSLTQLELLDLRESKLKHLPSSIGKLVNLSELFLWNCEVENLPDSIGSLTQLELLDLRRSKLKHIPNSIGKLVNLRILHLPYSELENLPYSIGSLTRLKE